MRTFSGLLGWIDRALVGIVFLILAAVVADSLGVVPTAAQSKLQPFGVFSHEPGIVSVDSLSRIIRKANPGITDPRTIQIGQLVWVPDEKGQFRAEAADSWALREPRGCMWWMARAELVRRAGIPVAARAPVSKGKVSAGTKILSPFPWKNLWFLVLVLGAFVLGAGYLYVHSINSLRLDPYRRPPVVRGGLSRDPAEALVQIQEASSRTLPTDPNRIILRTEPGRVVREDGREGSFTTQIHFRDGRSNARITSGTPCHRVTIGRRDDPNFEGTEYWLSLCGNLVGGQGRDCFELPQGWVFIPDPVRQPQPQPAAPDPVAPIAPESPVTTEAAPEPASTNGQADAEYTIDLRVTKTEKGLAVKGASSRYVSRIKAGEFEIEF